MSKPDDDDIKRRYPGVIPGLTDKEAGDFIEAIEEDAQATQVIRTREQAKADAAAAQRGGIHQVGVELMNAYNRDKTDPSVMAVLGHDTATGFEFCIERDGVVYTWRGSRNMGT